MFKKFPEIVYLYFPANGLLQPDFIYSIELQKETKI